MLTATNMEEMSSNNGKKNSPSGTSLFEHKHSSWCQWSAAPVAPQQTKSISHSVVFANWPFQKISWCCFLRLVFLLISLRCEVSRRLVGWCWLGWVEREEEKNVWKATDRCGQLSRNKPSLRIPVSWNKSLTAWCWFEVCVWTDSEGCSTCAPSISAPLWLIMMHARCECVFVRVWLLHLEASQGKSAPLALPGRRAHTRAQKHTVTREHGQSGTSAHFQISIRRSRR